MKLQTIGLVLAGRRNAERKFPHRLLAKPFFAPYGIQVLGGIISEVSSQYVLKVWDETLQGPVTTKFLEQLNYCFITGLSTSLYGMERIGRLAKSLDKTVILGGKGVTGLYYAQPEQNLPKLLEWSDGVCVGQLTTTVCVNILADCSLGNVSRLYKADPTEPMEWIKPRHDLAQRGHWFDRITCSSQGCSDACYFCMVHRCLPGGKRRIFYPKPIPILRPEIESFMVRSSLERLLAVLFGSPWFFDVCDSFGEDEDHTFGDGSDPNSGVLPLYRWSGLKWGTEGKIKTFKGNGDWRMLTEMAGSGCNAIYYGLEDIRNRITAKQASLTDVEEMNKRAMDLGMIAIGSLVLDGNKDVTEDDINWTIDWAVNSGIEIQFSNCAIIDSSDCQALAVRTGTLVDTNPEFSDGAWPQLYREHVSPQFRIEALAEAYAEVYSMRQIYRRLQKRGFSRNACLTAIGGIGVHASAKLWAKTHDYNYWLEHRIKPQEIE